MKYVFIINPRAGEGGAEERIRSEAVTAAGADNCEFHITTGPLDATKFVRERAEAAGGEELRFIACGGDGTVNEVFNGAVGFENVSVTCYPCGSGNDFVKVFGEQEKFSDIGALLKAPSQKLDLLKVGDRYADNVVNFGFDTTVAITINKEREKTGHGNKSAYTKGVVTALIKSMKNEFTVTADGEVLNPEGKALLCTLANGQYVGGSFRCAPRAKTDDGLIDVCIIRPISRLRFVKILGTYTEGKHLDDPAMSDIVIYRQAKKIEVSAPAGFAYSLDGEIIYENKFTVEIAEGAINFAAPE
ncbi:MAG: diacylglycerol kinase family lipid kinase [Clostridia bacterium]|nr:diacylglycerol kinase family lipid kinase [Clostridia bacterium]